MQDLRANTAIDVLIGPFVDKTDGNTPITDSTLVVELSKLGQGLATKNDGTDPVHDAGGTVDGCYNCELDATDTNTEGILTLAVHHTDSLFIRHDYMVLSEAAWDSLYAAKDVGFMDVNIKTIGRADAQETEATNLEAACAAYSVTRGLTGTAVPAVVAEAAGGFYTRGSGAGQINQGTNGQIDTDVQKVNGTAQTANDNSLDINRLVTALINKLIIEEINGNAEQFDDADGSLGTIATAFTTDGSFTTRLRQVQ